LARNAILFWLMIVAAVCAGIYLRGYQAKEKAPLIIHKDWANCVEPTADGGYIIAGVIWGMGGMQSAIYLVKTDAHGGKLWCKTFGQGDVNRGNSVQQTLDLGYIVAGTTWPKDEKHSDMVVVKTDPSGNEIWSRTYGGSRRDEGHSVRQTTDGGYIVAGQTDSFGNGNDDVYLLKTDASGNEIWSRTYGGNRRDEGHSVRQTTDGGYIVAGQTNSFGNANEKVYLLKTDPEGNLVWSRSLGEGGRDRGESVRQTLDGGYIVAGTTWPFEATYSDICLLKTDPEGREIWHKTFGGRYGDHGFTVEQTRDGGYIVAGNTWPVGRIGQSRMVLLRTDGRGEEMWVKSFGGEGSTYGYSVCPTVDGGYVVAGKMEDLDKGNDDICLLKTYGDGVLAWRMTGACP
jgi:hypothetical protein